MTLTIVTMPTIAPGCEAVFRAKPGCYPSGTGGKIAKKSFPSPVPCIHPVLMLGIWSALRSLSVAARPGWLGPLVAKKDEPKELQAKETKQ